MNALLLLATLVLHSGERIAVDGTPVRDNGVVLFRAGGLLYSMPEVEIASIEETSGEPAAPPVKKLKVSDEERKRLIAELENNHASGSAPATLPAVPELPKKEAPRGDEWSWRRQARSYEEDVRRAKEDLALLESRADELRDQIQSLFALGYQPRQFTYQTTQLARTEERIPAARLEVTRAERAWEQFREDARKQDIPPGWLR